jgi:hypothetical protein
MNFAIIGDVHSDSRKLKRALTYCDENKLIPLLLGDVFDSRITFSDSVGVYNLIKDYQSTNDLICLQSNHLDKLQRHLSGNKVVINNGLEKTVEDFKNSSVSSEELLSFILKLPYGIAFKDAKNIEYRCAHAYFPSSLEIPDYETYYLVKAVNKRDKNKFLYGPTRKEDNLRIEWWNQSQDKSWIRVAGHYHRVIDDKKTKSLLLDGSCGSCDLNGFLPLYDVNQRKILKF